MSDDPTDRLLQDLRRLADDAPSAPTTASIRRRLRQRAWRRAGGALAVAAAAGLAAAAVIHRDSATTAPERTAMPEPPLASIAPLTTTMTVDDARVHIAEVLSRLGITGEIDVSKDASGTISIIIVGDHRASVAEIRRALTELLASCDEAHLARDAGGIRLALVRNRTS